MKVDLPEDYRPSEEETYRNPKQLEYFKQKLVGWREQLVEGSLEISKQLKEKSLRQPDIVDQGALETDKSLKLRTRNRYIKLINKINDALERISNTTYGYCEETGKEIGIRPLEARPTATLCLEAQQRHEQAERRTRVRRPKTSPSKGGEVMKGYEADDVLGIYQKDGSVKCRECMNEEDWKNLTQEDIITSKAIERGGEWICCDYCEKKL
jgi:DnaK suppressor protein